MFTKVIEVSNNKSVFKHDSFGGVNLYSEGTTRKIKTLTLFGWKIKKQICEINYCCDSGGSVVYFNNWIST